MPAAENHSLRGMWLVLTMTGMCMTTVMYNTTAIVTLLPVLNTALDLSPTAQQWVMAIYMVAAATLMPLMGRGADLFGKLRIFVLGIVLFAAGSAIGGLANDGNWLLLGRMIQGMGAASLFGTSLSVLSAATPAAKKPLVLGLWGALIALGMSLGPIIGGLFGEYLSWRWIFYLDITVLACALLLVRLVHRGEYISQPAPRKEPLDYLGGVLIIFFLAPLAYGLSHSEAAGWSNIITLGAIGIGITAGIAFIWREQNCTSPLLYVDYLRHPRFMMANLGTLLTGFVLLGFFIFFNLFMQSADTFAMSPVMAGAAVMPVTGMMLILSIMGPKVLGPYSYRWPVTIGMLCLAPGSFLLAFTTNTSAYTEMWWKLLVLGVGLGLTMPLLPRVGLRVLAEEHAGQGSGMINASMAFGATLGSVLCGVAHIASVKAHLNEVITTLPGDSKQHADLVAVLSSGTGSEIEAALAGIDPATSQALATALRDVQDDAFAAAMLVCAGVALFGAAMACYLMRGPVPEEGSAAQLVRH